MCLFTVVHEPCEVTGSEIRIEIAVHDRSTARVRRWQHLLGTDQERLIAIESEQRSDSRPCPIGADREPCTNRPATIRSRAAVHVEPQFDAAAARAGRARSRQAVSWKEAGSSSFSLLPRPCVEPLHAPDAKLVVRTRELDRAQARRVEDDVTNRRSEAAVGKREVLERTADEDPGRVHPLSEAVLLIDEQRVQTAEREAASTGETGETRTDHHDVAALHFDEGTRRGPSLFRSCRCNSANTRA
jgi:hypothetical protein